MQFYIDADHGTSIHGWVAPDNPGLIPTIRIIVPGQADVEVLATETRPDLKDAGLHGSGLVGFIVHAGHVEDLAQRGDLEIIDAETGTQIYRRNDVTRHLQRKVVYVDISLMPQNAVYHHLNSKFAMHYNFVERYPYDTMGCFINREFIRSVVLTGRPYLSRYAPQFKNKDFFMSVLVGDPYEELAERLMFMQMLGRSNAAHLLPTFSTGVEPLIDFTSALDLDDDKALTAALRSASDPVKKALTSPMVRVMGGAAGEEVERRHLSMALDNLSNVEVVGLKNRFAEFRAIIAGLLGTDIIGDGYTMVSPAVSALADRLSRLSPVNNLLELDLVFYSYVEDAIGSGLSAEIG